MAFNIVDLVKDQISDAVVEQLGGVLGGSAGDASKAVDGAIPSILEGLMNKAGSADGAESIFKAVQDQDDGILSNIGDLIGGGVDSPFASMGFTVLKSLLGNGMLGNIAGAIGGFSGLGRSKSSSLLGLVAPIIMSVVKRKVLGGGLNAASLASMLTGQKDNISAAMPAGFAQHLSSGDVVDNVADSVKSGASAVGSAAASATSAVTDAATSGASAVGNAAADTASAGGGLLGKLIPAILLAAAAYFGLKMFGNKPAEVVTAPAEVVTAPAAEVVTAPAEVVTETVMIKSTDDQAVRGSVIEDAAGVASETVMIKSTDDQAVRGSVVEDAAGVVNEKVMIKSTDDQAVRGSVVEDVIDVVTDIVE